MSNEELLPKAGLDPEKSAAVCASKVLVLYKFPNCKFAPLWIEANVWVIPVETVSNTDETTLPVVARTELTPPATRPANEGGRLFIAAIPLFKAL